MIREAWSIAIETLSWIQLHRLSERLALAKTAKQLGIENPEALNLAHKLVLETTRRKNLIDYIISLALPRPLDELKLGQQAFLRLFTYEVKILNGGLKRAVDVAKTGRSILGWREIEELEETLGKILSIQLDQALNGLSDEKKVSLLTCHPTWFVKYCFKLLGRGEAIKLLEKSMDAPPTYIRINTLKASEEKILKEMESEGVTLEKVNGLRHTYIVVKSEKPLSRIKSFKKGLFYVQDKASCLAAEVANPKPGMTILDVCAAPGAKTTYLAQLMENKGKIYSIDYSKRSMKVWRNEVNRMGVKIAVPILADACKPLPLTELADLVVLDPPCTSTGVFSKAPSTKWRLTKRSPLGMAELQWRMLDVCSGHVREGGFLIYSTCSITLEENEVLIERFLRWHPEFKLVEASPRIGLPGFRGLKECQRLFPHIHNCNGFFVAKLQKQ